MATTIQYTGEIFQGTTLPAKEIDIRINGVPLDFDDCNIYMKFKHGSKQGATVHSASLVDRAGRGISIVDDAAGKFRIDSFKIASPEGRVFFDILFIFKGDNRRRLYFEGDFMVKQTVTDIP